MGDAVERPDRGAAPAGSDHAGAADGKRRPRLKRRPLRRERVRRSREAILGFPFFVYGAVDGTTGVVAGKGAFDDDGRRENSRIQCTSAHVTADSARAALAMKERQRFRYRIMAGRQLDCVPASLRALAEVVAAVKGQVKILMDGGIRRGTDIVKAICLGAHAVLCGRAYAYGLAAAAELGVARAIEIVRTDLKRTLRLLGCPSVSALVRSSTA